VRIAIVSDIHANLAAFEAVRVHAQSVGYDRMVCLGDVVGYGPDPVECVDLVRATCEFTLLGNHDFAAVYEPTNFNPVARSAAFWTRDRLFASMQPDAIKHERAQLARRLAAGEILAETHAILDASLADSKGRVDFLFRISPRQILLDRYICVHGSPSRPVNEYLFPQDAELGTHRLDRNFRLLTLPQADGSERRVSAIVGHTHTPGFMLEESEGVYEWVGLPDTLLGDAVSTGAASWTPMANEMPRGLRFILNPGSVGQPRDGDPRASYVTLELGEGDAQDVFTFHRVEYDIARTQERIFALGRGGAPLADWLAERLAVGQ
jgi:predicted phosphodiesterase